MTLIALEIPKVGLVMENARLVRWLKSVGDLVRQGEPLVELETEKSLVEIEATHSGLLKEILLQADAEAHVGDQLAWLETEAAIVAPSASTPDSPPAPALSNEATQKLAVSGSGGERVRSSPVARRLAKQQGIDISQLRGTGPGGRVQLADVRQALDLPSLSHSQSSTAAAPQRLSSMRRAVARSMTLSNATVPQFTLERTFDCTAWQRHRQRMIHELQPGTVRPSANDYLLQALAGSLLAFPTLNAIFSGDPDAADAALLPAVGAHIGLVVAVEGGLIVPVIHDIEQLGLIELARRRSDLVQRSLQGKLRREELEGATISLSNLGSRGPDRFTALINPPQSAILAVGRQRESVVAVNGKLLVTTTSHLTLSVDHRVADGRLGSDFLNALVDILEGDSWWDV
ncbi:MAG: dihydrolipoamide acetyltransferase family protein [Steroidobacteraceae bacterium]